jgi:hypothetical protein
LETLIVATIAVAASIWAYKNGKRLGQKLGYRAARRHHRRRLGRHRARRGR